MLPVKVQTQLTVSAIMAELRAHAETVEAQRAEGNPGGSMRAAARKVKAALGGWKAEALPQETVTALALAIYKKNARATAKASDEIYRRLRLEEKRRAHRRRMQQIHDQCRNDLEYFYESQQLRNTFALPPYEAFSFCRSSKEPYEHCVEFNNYILLAPYKMVISEYFCVLASHEVRKLARNENYARIGIYRAFQCFQGASYFKSPELPKKFGKAYKQFHWRVEQVLRQKVLCVALAQNRNHKNPAKNYPKLPVELLEWIFCRMLRVAE